MPEWRGTDEELEQEMLDAQGWSAHDEEMLRASEEYILAIEGMTPCEVNHPPHYTAGGIEALDVLRAKLTPEEYRGYLKGNILKYLLRANFKGKHDQDIGKSTFYAKELENATKKAQT